MPDSRHSPDALDHVVGGAAVREHLAAAEAAGRVVAREGGWTLPPARGPQPDPWMYSARTLAANCEHQIAFLFKGAYGGAAVPWGCRACYKVKVQPRTLRELVAVWEIAKQGDDIYKCGVDTTPHNAGMYAAFFYADGLDDARRMYARLRAAIDAAARLGPSVPMLIKRGCTEFELACGPSDRYTFAPELEGVEAWLLAHLVDADRARPAATSLDGARTLQHWIKTAYKIGDETYLDLTNGRRLFPATVSYPVTP